MSARNLIRINTNNNTNVNNTIPSLPALFISNSRSLLSKTDELSCTVANHSIDVAVITETWLSADISNSAVDLPGYSVIRHDRSDGRRGGGVCAYVKDFVPLTHLNDLSNPNFESLWLLLKPHRLPRGLNSIILGVIYHPPANNDSDLQTHITENLDSILSVHPNSGIILAGDFNQFRHQRLCTSFNLKQIVKQATRGNNILDKIFTNISKYYETPNIVAPLCSSDHNSIVLNPIKSRGNFNIRSSRFVRDARPSNRKVVSENLAKVNWTPLYHLQSCDEQFRFFTNTVNDICEKFLPPQRVKTDSSDKPWITPEIKRLIKKRQRSWSRGNDIAFKHYRNTVIVKCKKARSCYFKRNIADVQQSNPKKWWSAVKNIAGLSSPKSVKSLMYNNRPYQGKELADLFNDKFVAVGSNLPPLDWTPLLVNDYPPDFIISVEDTETALLSTKLHSAAGPDDISGWFIRENASTLCRPLCSIFNSSLREGFVPSLWKSANVSPIPKLSPALDIDSDFRPISLTAILSKILESFPYRWLLQSIINQIDPLQFGSLRGSSASMALIHLFHKWYEACDNIESTLRICLLDFSKAFDRIDHNVLLRKLQQMTVHPILINWIADFLSDRLQRTKIGDEYSAWNYIRAGVPQGTKLGPLLFLIMVNDLRPSNDLVKFVDDSTMWELLYKGSSSQLPSAVKECEEWSKLNNMKLNASKTKEMRVNFSPSSPSFQSIVINNQTINVVKHAKLLGVTISDDLKWNLHVNTICKKASKRLYALRLLRRNAIPTSVLVQVYCTCVRPILEYACEVWHYNLPVYLSNQIEQIQKRAFRIIFPSLTYDQAMLNTNISSLHDRRRTLCERLFRKMLDPTHKLHPLVPARRDNHHNLRQTRSFEVPVCRTDRFHKSFIPSVATFFTHNN